MKFDIMRCAVAIAGDQRQIVHIGETGDLTWPEVVILTAIHGAHSVTEIAVTGERDDIIPEVELDRLKKKYPGVAGAVFSGYAAQIPPKAPDHIERFDDEIIERTVIRHRRGTAPVAQAVPATAAEAAKAPDPAPAKPDRTAAARAAKAAKAAAAASGAGGSDGADDGSDDAGGGADDDQGGAE